MFLTPEELSDLTGYSQRAKQAEWLSVHGWPHVVNATGRVLVLRDYMTARMSGVDTRTPTAHATKAHKFAALA